LYEEPEFFTVEPGQVLAAQQRLGGQGCISVERREKKIYSLTPAGQEQFEELGRKALARILAREYR
jgi:DNA-binding PadR family transcriptional regulator